jgi:hypothetical protein
MKAATRDQEKKLAFSAFASVPSAAAAAALKPFLAEGSLQGDAALAGVRLAEAMARTDRSAAKSLAQAIKDAHPTADITRRADAVLRR